MVSKHDVTLNIVSFYIWKKKSNLFPFYILILFIIVTCPHGIIPQETMPDKYRVPFWSQFSQSNIYLRMKDDWQCWHDEWWCLWIWTGCATITDDFSELPKIYVADFGSLYRAFFGRFTEKVCNTPFQIWGGGVKGRLNFFRKFICFGSATPPIR